jgi:type II secretory pathway component PulF
MAKAKTDMLLDFVYDGVNRRGQKVKGETTSRSLELAKATLRKQGITVKGIKKKPKPLYTSWIQHRSATHPKLDFTSSGVLNPSTFLGRLFKLSSID